MVRLGKLPGCLRRITSAPTTLSALTNGTTGQATLIAPEELNLDGRLERVGDLVRTETEHFVVGYTFDLHANKLTPELAPNPTAGKQHSFAAYRLQGMGSGAVSMKDIEHVEAQLALGEDE